MKGLSLHSPECLSNYPARKAKVLQSPLSECSVKEGRIWTTNGPESNIFGVDPNYGCCTANLSQGWPKFASNLWMQTADNGIAAVAYAPSQVSLEIDGTAVCVKLDTDYPFRDVRNSHPIFGASYGRWSPA